MYFSQKLVDLVIISSFKHKTPLFRQLCPKPGNNEAFDRLVQYSGLQILTRKKKISRFTMYNVLQGGVFFFSGFLSIVTFIYSSVSILEVQVFPIFHAANLLKQASELG